MSLWSPILQVTAIIGHIKWVNDKVASRQPGDIAVAGGTVAAGAVEVTCPIAAITMAHIAGQTVMDTWFE